MIQEVTGILLAGGKSHRFGSNKSLCLWKGKRLIENAANILKLLFPVNFVLVKETDIYKFLNSANMQVVKDVFSDTHSLGGIYSGLNQIKTKYAFICASDMPFIKPDLIKFICDSSKGYDTGIPVFQKNIQPLCAIYSRDCMEVIHSMISKKDFKIKNLFSAVKTRFFNEEEIRLSDPDGISFVDIDTVEDYKKAILKSADQSSHDLHSGHSSFI